MLLFNIILYLFNTFLLNRIREKADANEAKIDKILVSKHILVTFAVLNIQSCNILG